MEEEERMLLEEEEEEEDEDVELPMCSWEDIQFQCLEIHNLFVSKVIQKEK